MTDDQIADIHRLLRRDHPDSVIVTAQDKAEIVAELAPGLAIAVIELSIPHFHRYMTERYVVMQGTLHVSVGGLGYVLGPGDALDIAPGRIHSARAAAEPAWVRVTSTPAWSPTDHLLV